jgi:hypothetical protein
LGLRSGLGLELGLGFVHLNGLRWVAYTDTVAMVQMNNQRVFADCYGMSIIRISRRYVADIYFRLCRYCTW